MYNIGVDLGGTKIGVGIVDENYKIIAQDKTPTLTQRDSIELTKDMVALCKKLLEEKGISWDEIHSVGIASPGSIDPINKIIKYANNLRMDHYPIAKDFAELSGFDINRIFIENDANAAAWGEHVGGAAKGHTSSILITLGTGLGGGIILNSKIYTGFNYAGGELGHMVIEHNGRPCTCGRHGCWEAYSSASGLIKATKKSMQANVDSAMWEIADGSLKNVGARTAWEAMRAGDPAGKALVNEYIDYLACGITNIINIFQPEIFSIGGGISNEGDNLLKPLMKIVSCDQYGNDMNDRSILKIAELKNDAGIVGAANLYQNYAEDTL